MSGTNLVSARIWASASVDSDATTPVYFHQEGFASTAITRSAAGTYVLTLSQGVSATSAYFLHALRGAAAGLMTAALTTATTITTISWTITVGADADTALGDLDYDLVVFRKMG